MPLVRTALPNPSKTQRERQRRGKSEGQGQGQGQWQGIGGWRGKGTEGSALTFSSWDLCRRLPRAGSRGCRLRPRRRSRITRVRRGTCCARFRQRQGCGNLRGYIRKSLIMALIKGSACIAQGRARREWYKIPKGRKYFQQQRSRLSYKGLKIPEVGGRVAEGLRQSNQLEISTQRCHSFASPQIQSFDSKGFRRNHVRSGGNMVRPHYAWMFPSLLDAFRLSKYCFLSSLHFSTTGPIYRPPHDENDGYDCKREHRKRKRLRRCIFLVGVLYRSEQNLELRPQQCLGTPPGKGCRQQPHYYEGGIGKGFQHLKLMRRTRSFFQSDCFDNAGHDPYVFRTEKDSYYKKQAFAFHASWYVFSSVYALDTIDQRLTIIQIYPGISSDP